MPPSTAPRSARGPGWYLRRLSVMGPAELLHRVGEQLTLRRLRAGHGRPWPAPPGPLAFCVSRQPQLPELPWDEAGILDQAGELLDGRWPALGFDWRWSAAGNPWHTAPDTGRAWPTGFFAAIPHRPGNPYGDVRVMWEPARLQQLVSLALLARRAPAPVAARAVRLLEDQLLSFHAANPPWAGVHYISAMECALRLLAACHAVDMVRDRLERPAQVFAALGQLASSHAELVARRLSLYSSAGNHTVAECAGLVYAGTLFPELPGAAAWHEQGLRLLAAELQRQVLDDGGGLEQAPWYLLLVTDLAGLVARLLAHHAQPVPAALDDRLALARDYLGALAREPAALPHVGDRDDGYALSPALRLSFAAPAPAPVRTFPRTGQTLLRLGPEGESEVLFDHGPLGMAPAFGHGHADALAVCLRRRGRELLLDPGTFSYTGDPAWRGYFRSTAAHNTVTVDGLDQAVQETAFMWSRPYRCELRRTERQDGLFRCLARHDGYARLPGKVVHWRGLVARFEGTLLVWDYLDGAGAHDVELRWHAGARVARAGGAWLLGDELLLEVSGGQEAGALTGSQEPAGGWHAERYGRRVPATTLRARHRGPLPCEFVSRVFPRGLPPPEREVSEDLEIFRAWVRQP